MRSPSFEMRLPSVVSLKAYVKPALYPAFTRFNVFLRDRFMCQYAATRTTSPSTTHPALARRPDAVGQRRDCVRALQSEQGRASADHAGMQPRQQPYRPTVFELHRNGRLFPPNYLHDSWLDYLYWDIPSSGLISLTRQAGRGKVPRGGKSPEKGAMARNGRKIGRPCHC